MNYFRYIAVLLVALTLQSPAQSADQPGPNLALGIALKGGITNTYMKDIEGIDTDGIGYNAGAGLIIEKMFTNRFGIHTGLTYEYSKTYFEMDDGLGENTDAEWSSQSISLPMLFITSFNSEIISLNLLFGFTYRNIFISDMQNDENDHITTDNALKYIDSNQLGPTLGMTLKFRATKFTDFFIGAEGTCFCTNLLRNHKSDESIHIYETSLITGWMFRTEIFPMEQY